MWRVPDLRDNISSQTSLYREPGLHHTIAIKRLFEVCQIYSISPNTYLYRVPKTAVCRVHGLRDNFFPQTSLYRVPGLRDTIALNPLCAVCQAYVTQLPSNVCVSCGRFS